MSKRVISDVSVSVSDESMPLVRSPYNYDRMAASDESGLRCDDPSLTSQSFTRESDINWIVDNFVKTGELAPGLRPPQFGDFTDLPSDFHAALNQVRNAEAAFMTLPAKVRSEFGNDPGRLLDFLQDPKNHDRAVELGIVDRKDLSPGDRIAHPTGQGVSPGGKSGSQPKPSKKEVSVEPEGGSGGDE